jgi:hypothetical protein
MLKCDKFLIEEMQKAGYDIDYKRLTDIYRQSRKNPMYIRKQERNMRENEMIDRMHEEMIKRFGKK